jgi:hypothetical protein
MPEMPPGNVPPARTRKPLLDMGQGSREQYFAGRRRGPRLVQDEGSDIEPKLP